LTHSFRGFIPWPCCLGPVVRQPIMVGLHGRGSCSHHATRKQKKETESVPHPNIPFRGTSPVIKPCSLSPTTSQQCHTLGPSLQLRDLWGTLQIQTITNPTWMIYLDEAGSDPGHLNCVSQDSSGVPSGSLKGG
jgi:hypothetical protein